LTEVEIIKAELEEKQFKVKLTVIDTPGFGDYVNNRDSWTPIVDFIDDQHEAYMRQEQQPQRHEKTDLRVHACLYFIRPTGHTYARPLFSISGILIMVSSLKPLDIEIMKRLGTRVNLIPVVAKADTLTQDGLFDFKERVSYLNSCILFTSSYNAVADSPGHNSPEYPDLQTPSRVR
jgi:cell division control protein 12